MEQDIIIDKIKIQVKKIFKGEFSGHDWFHIERVWKNAKAIAKKEGANLLITEIGALLHDISDHKFVENFEEESILRTEQILKPYDLKDEVVDAIKHIVLHCSFKGGTSNNKMKSLEGKIVQDADKLDAIGAVGIARAFAFGGKFGSILYDPDIPPINHQSLESYHKNRSHTINHFYEKLLKLKSLMHTDTAKKEAKKRHEYMEVFLQQFYDEWEAQINL